MQASFVAEFFEACKGIGINTALDTSGCIYNDDVERLLEATDTVLLDYKYTNDADYQRYVGMNRKKVEDFLEILEEKKKSVWIRQVIIPTLNDTEESVLRLYELQKKYSCIERIELLPFRKLCLEKYEFAGIEFKLRDLPEASLELIARLEALKNNFTE